MILRMVAVKWRQRLIIETENPPLHVLLALYSPPSDAIHFLRRQLVCPPYFAKIERDNRRDAANFLPFSRSLQPLLQQSWLSIAGSEVATMTRSGREYDDRGVSGNATCPSRSIVGEEARGQLGFLRKLSPHPLDTDGAKSMGSGLVI